MKVQPSATSPLNGDGQPRPLRIVVADHDPAMCQFYRETLARRGYHVCATETGPQLVEQCRLLHPELVIHTRHAGRGPGTGLTRTPRAGKKVLPCRAPVEPNGQEPR